LKKFDTRYNKINEEPYLTSMKGLMSDIITMKSTIYKDEVDKRRNTSKNVNLDEDVSKRKRKTTITN